MPREWGAVGDKEAQVWRHSSGLNHGGSWLPQKHSKRSYLEALQEHSSVKSPGHGCVEAPVPPSPRCCQGNNSPSVSSSRAWRFPRAIPPGANGAPSRRSQKDSCHHTSHIAQDFRWHSHTRRSHECPCARVCVCVTQPLGEGWSMLSQRGRQVPPEVLVSLSHFT